MQLAGDLYKERLLKGAVPEARTARRFLCDQKCGMHLFDLNGVPHEQIGGEKHDCPEARTGKMWTGHLNLIPIERIRAASMAELPTVLENQEKFNRRWNQAFELWKETGIKPKTKEVNRWPQP